MKHFILPIVYVLAGIGLAAAWINKDFFEPLRQPFLDFLNSNFSTAFFGAVAGSATIILMEWVKRQRLFLADINTAMLVQVVDIIAGAIQYTHRFPNGGASPYKNELCEHIKKRAGLSLLRSTPAGAEKFNLLMWESASNV